MTDDVTFTDEIMERYVIFLLEGFTIQNIKIKADTIYGYMLCVNAYYKKYRCNPPYDKKTETAAAKLLKNQKDFEGAPDKREPLHDRVIVKMYELSKEGDKYGIRRAIWL